MFDLERPVSSLCVPLVTGLLFFKWVWLGDSSSELCTPVLLSIKLRLCWHGVGPGSACVWSLLLL